MEVRARYTLMGLFTLLAIGVGFAFVYWLQAPGRVGQRAVYRIQFDGPVSGLLKGSSVLFNGVHVGEVTDLVLAPTNPVGVMATIAIERRAPVCADTKISIDFQGLTGAPVISLSGGSSSLPALTSLKDEPPVLLADKTAGQGMSQTANEVLRHIDTMVNDNAAPLRSAIANIDTFAGTLAKNSAKVDGIVAGLERLTGGGAKAQSRVYDLIAAQSVPGLKNLPTGQLLVAEPTALSIFDSDKLIVRAGAVHAPALEGAQWPDVLPKVLQARILQSFENAQYLLVLGRAPEGTRTDFQLLIDIRSFQMLTQPSLSAEVELSAKIIGQDGRIVSARIFRGSMPVETLDAPSSAKALSDAFVAVSTDVVLWVCATI